MSKIIDKEGENIFLTPFKEFEKIVNDYDGDICSFIENLERNNVDMKIDWQFDKIENAHLLFKVFWQKIPNITDLAIEEGVSKEEFEKEYKSQIEELYKDVYEMFTSVDIDETELQIRYFIAMKCKSQMDIYDIAVLFNDGHCYMNIFEQFIAAFKLEGELAKRFAKKKVDINDDQLEVFGNELDKISLKVHKTLEKTKTTKCSSITTPQMNVLFCE